MKLKKSGGIRNYITKPIYDLYSQQYGISQDNEQEKEILDKEVL